MPGSGGFEKSEPPFLHPVGGMWEDTAMRLRCQNLIDIHLSKKA